MEFSKDTGVIHRGFQFGQADSSTHTVTCLLLHNQPVSVGYSLLEGSAPLFPLSGHSTQDANPQRREAWRSNWTVSLFLGYCALIENPQGDLEEREQMLIGNNCLTVVIGVREGSKDR